MDSPRRQQQPRQRLGETHRFTFIPFLYKVYVLFLVRGSFGRYGKHINNGCDEVCKFITQIKKRVVSLTGLSLVLFIGKFG